MIYRLNVPVTDYQEIPARRVISMFRLYLRATDRSLCDIEKELESYAIDFASKS